MMKFIFLFIFSSSAYAANFFPTDAELLSSSAYLIQMSASYFKTSGFFDEAGTLNTLPEGDNFSLMNSDFKISYGISNRIETGLIARLRKVSSIHSANNVTKLGAESVGIFLKYGLPSLGDLKSAIGIRYRKALYTNAKYDPPQIASEDEIVLGDDGSNYAVDFFSTYLQSSLKYIGKLSYFSPANILSSEIQYKLEGQYLFTNLSLIGGIDGALSLNNDPETSTTKPQISRGATHLFNGVDREFLAPYIGMNYSFKEFAIGLLAQSIMKGKSIDAGSLIAFNISLGAKEVTPDAVKIESFKEYLVDALVLKVSARGNFFKIDQGLSSDIEKGMHVDIYETGSSGGSDLVAIGIIIEVAPDSSSIKLIKKYKNIEIKPGFVARGY